jgi:hypothetical protein
MAASSFTETEESVLNFANPEVYNKLILNTPTVYNSETYGISETFEIPMIRIPKGAILYRADRKGAQKPSESVPIFFSDRESIRMYQQNRTPQGKILNRGEQAITKYKVKENLRLLRFDFDSIPKLQNMLKKIIKEGKDEYKNIVSIDELKLLVFYLNPRYGAVLPTLPAKMYRETSETEYLEYLNRDISNIICKLGFDGWIVLPFDAEKRQGLIQLSLITKQDSVYPPEIMLCNWTRHLELLTPLKGGKRTAKQSRRHKKTRRSARR